MRPIPTANYTISDACWPQEPLCTGMLFDLDGNSSVSQPLGGSLDFSYWILDGGTPVTIPYSNTYSTSFTPAGQHTIQYIVETEYGCLDTTEIDTVDVVDIPICGFDVIDTLCVNDSSIYVNTNLSTGYILTYQWEIFNSTGTQQVWNSGWLPWINIGVNIPAFPSLFQSSSDTSYVISLSVGNCCDTVTCTDTIIIQPLPIIGQGIYNNPVYIATGNTTTVFLNSYIDTINTDTVFIDWGDATYDTVISQAPIQPYFSNQIHTYNNIGIYPISITATNNCGQTDTTLYIEVVYNPLVSEFLMLDSNGCAGNCFQFRETSFQHPNMQVYWCWEWDATLTPNCNSSNNPTWISYQLDDIITHCYTDPGEYNIYHKIQDTLTGFWDTTVYQVIVYPNPEAKIDSCNNVCEGISSTWYDGSTIDNNQMSPNNISNIVGRDWFVDGNYITSTTNLTHTFSQCGNHEIVLQVTTDSDPPCIDYDTCNIFVYCLPTADFDVFPDSSCLGNGITQFDGGIPISTNGTGQIQNYDWTFVSSANPPTSCCSSLSQTTFINNGNWFVDLEVTDQYGCTDRHTDTIIINGSMTANFNWDIACEGDSTHFNSEYPLSSPNANAWLWDFGDGGSSTQQNPTHKFNSAGDYVVKLTVYDTGYLDSTDCMHDTTFIVHVREKPIAIFTADTACWGDATNFIDLSFQGDTLLETVRSWYFDSDTLIDATSLNPTNIFDSCGLNFYNITMSVTDLYSCSDDTTISISISCPPTASFVMDTVCLGYPTRDSNTSIPGTFQITNYQWYNFIGYYPGFSVNYTPVTNFTFLNSGWQNVTTLIISDYLGCSDTISEFAFVYTNPTAIISAIDTVCEGTQIDFNSLFSIDGSTSINQWIWDFGDGNTSTIQNPSYTYIDTCGLFSVSLQVVDSNGCTHDTTYNIFINCNPNADFTWVSVCEGIETSFNDNSTTPQNFNITSWEWNFGITAGIDDIVQDPSYLYDTCGNDIFTVTLVVGDNQTPVNCYNTYQETISVACNPIASFYSDTVCVGDNTLFTSTSTSGGTDSIMSYTWTHYDGTYVPPLNNPTSMFTFNNSGITSPSELVVMTNYGCTDTVFNISYVRANPIASWNTINTNYCEDSTIYFMDNSTLSDGSSPTLGVGGNINTNWWIFQNGLTSNLTNTISDILNTNVIYYTGGTWDIYYYIEDQYGCYDLDTTPINIDYLPNIDFKWIDTCAGKDICFIDLSTQTTNPIVQWDWDWMDASGDHSSDTNSCYDFPFVSSVTGSYHSVSLTIMDDQGCRNYMERDSIEIWPVPIAKIDLKDICQGQEPFYFGDTSSLNSTIFNHIFNDYDRNWLFNSLEPVPKENNNVWNFNPLTDSPINNPSFPAGSYDVTLYVISDHGCSDFRTKPVKYEQQPIINFDTLIDGYPNIPCLLTGETIDYTYTNNSLYYNNYLFTIWDSLHSNFIANDTSNNIGVAYTYTIPHAGIFDFNLLLENEINSNLTCIDTVSFKIHVYPEPIAEFNPCDTAGCDSLVVNFRDITDDKYSEGYKLHGGIDSISYWEWNFGDATLPVYNTDNIIHTYYNTQDVNYYPQLTIETNNGCISKTVNCNIFVKSTPIASFVTPPTQGNSPPFGTYWFESSSTTGDGITSATSSEYDFTWKLNEEIGQAIIFNANHPRVIEGVPDTILFQYNSFPDPIDGFSNVTAWLIVEDKIAVNGVTCVDSVKYTFPIAYYNGLYVPNSLAPGSGASYDEWTYFLPKGKSLIEYELSIFDKFGNIIFRTNKLDVTGAPLEAWDGTRNEIPLPQGTYIWKIQAVFSDGSSWPGIGYSNNPDDPYVDINNKGKRSGAIYLIR